MARIVSTNPQNINIVGISLYRKNPKIKAARGSAPDNSIDEIPESIYFKLKVEKIYGRANENVECMIKNMMHKMGSIEMKFVIWLKLVNGISAIEINTIE